MTTSHDAIEDVVGVGPTLTFHDQTIVLFENRLTAEYGLRDGWGVGLVFPYRIVDTRIRFVDPSGREVVLTAPNIHHRNETLHGVADPWLFAHVAFAAGRWTLDARLGATLPLGVTREDPFRLGDMGLPHEHLQFGTGTFNPQASVEVGRGLAGWRLSGWLLTLQALYENAHGYQAGDRYAAGVVGASPLGTKAWSFQVGAETQAETAETWGGVAHADDGNRGRIDVLASAGASWRANAWLQLDASVRVPLYTHVVGGQLSYPLLATVGVTTTFELLGGEGEAGHHHHGDDDDDDDDDAHHHHDEDGAAPPAADWTGVDMAEIAANGEAAPLVPVPGVVTVFDFWAPWCKPCKALDVRLVELAHRYPGRLAIRKVNVVDWDSAAAAKYLVPHGYNLPHVKVYGADGKPLFEESSDPNAIAARVEAALAPAAGASAARPTRVVIAVTEKGFEPAYVRVPAGVPVTLVFTRRTDDTCATSVVLDPGSGELEGQLPLGEPVEVTVTFAKPGEYRYGCGMDMMVSGVIAAE
jgi:thiol-disulfide isomerase/thioredoxin